MNETLASLKIVEIQEGGKYIANHYLGHGYFLLDVQTGTRAQPFPEGWTNAGQGYVRRNPVYVLGRPEGVKAAPRPVPYARRRGAAEAAEAAGAADAVADTPEAEASET